LAVASSARNFGEPVPRWHLVHGGCVVETPTEEGRSKYLRLEGALFGGRKEVIHADRYNYEMGPHDILDHITAFLQTEEEVKGSAPRWCNLPQWLKEAKVRTPVRTWSKSDRGPPQLVPKLGSGKTELGSPSSRNQ
jgi:hypothetical protein